MKRYGLIVFLIILIFLSKYPAYAIEDTIIMSGEPNFPPYEFVSEDGEYKGFNIDLMRALSLELKTEIKLIPISWIDVHNSLENGDIDAIQGMNFNEKRKELYDFSEPYLVNSTILFLNIDNEEILNYDELRGKRIAVQRSSTAAYILSEIGDLEVAFFSDLEEAFIKLRDGKVDAVFGDKLSGAYILKKLDMNKDIKTLGEALSRVNYGVAVKKGNTELLEEINKGLERLKRNGTYDKIFEKWFGKTDTTTWEDIKNYVYVGLGSLLALLFVVLLNIKWNRSLKKEVDKRTKQLKILNNELEKSRTIVEERDLFKQQIIDSLSVGLITFDNNKDITDINKKAEEVFQVKKDQITGKNFDELGLYSFFKERDIERSIKEEITVEVEEINYKNQGKDKYYNYVMSPIVVGDNIIKGGVITFRDITQERNINKELIEKDKMHSLGRLITGIAHEIRNPLTSIKAYLEALPKKYDNPKFREKITDQVPREINRLNDLLKELLEYSKPRVSEKRKFSLNTIVFEVGKLLDNLLEERNIKLIINMEEDTIVYGDKQKIKQVLINLTLNSIEAIEDGGQIEIQGYTIGKKVKIKIKDNGSGIDRERLENIFEPFYTTKETGTGLGLLICYQHIKENKGKIKITSEKNKGTRVYITLNKEEIGEGHE